MKKVIVALFLLLTIENAVAVKGAYIAFGQGSGSGTEQRRFTDNLWGGTTKVDVGFDVTLTDFKVGVVFESDNRFELSSTSIDAKFSSWTEKFTGTDFDWIFTAEKGEADFLAFMLVGFGTYEFERLSLRGAAFNFGLGVYVPVSDNVEVELAYKMKAIGWDEYDIGGNTSLYALESIDYVYVGAKYKF